MVLLREDLWQALFQAVRTLQLGALAGAGQVALSLWLHLGGQLMLQLEAFLQVILLRLAQGSRNAPSHHQEAALEVNRGPQSTVEAEGESQSVYFFLSETSLRVQYFPTFETVMMQSLKGS